MQLDTRKLKQLDTLLQQEVDSGRLPGATYAIGFGPEVVHQHAVGFAENRHGVVRSMQLDTIFDLASLTKVMSTLPSILRLIDEGKVRLDDAVALFLPEYEGGDKALVTLRHLLTHSSGLISQQNYYQLAQSRAELLHMIRTEALECQPNQMVRYSDLGFILLGEIVEAVTGQRIDRYAVDHVFGPLGMDATGFCPEQSLRAKTAATEEFADLGVKVGVVHDENAFALGGVAGHAGLFAPLQDVVKYVQMWLAKDNPVLSQAVRKLAVRSHTDHLGGHRGLGFTCRHDAYDHTGDLWPETTVGHTGFTGTSLAFDPVSQLWCVLLTNDVHYGRENKIIVRLRAQAHNIIGAALVD